MKLYVGVTDLTPRLGACISRPVKGYTSSLGDCRFFLSDGIRSSGHGSAERRRVTVVSAIEVLGREPSLLSEARGLGSRGGQRGRRTLPAERLLGGVQRVAGALADSTPPWSSSGNASGARCDLCAAGPARWSRRSCAAQGRSRSRSRSSCAIRTARARRCRRRTWPRSEARSRGSCTTVRPAGTSSATPHMALGGGPSTKGATRAGEARRGCSAWTSSSAEAFGHLLRCWLEEPVSEGGGVRATNTGCCR